LRERATVAILSREKMLLNVARFPSSTNHPALTVRRRAHDLGLGKEKKEKEAKRKSV